MLRYTNNKIRYILLLAILPAAHLMAQHAMGEDPDRKVDKSTYRVEFLEQYNFESEGGGSWVGELIFGKKDNALLKPVSISAKSRDALWVADQGRGRLYRYFEGKAKQVPTRKNREEPFPSLVSTCILPGGKLAVTDSRLNRIYIYDQGREELTVLNDSLILDKPTGILYLEERNEFWVCETGRHRIVVMDMLGNLLRTLGNQGSGPGEFNFPTHLCLDTEGDVLIVDAMNYRIQEFSPEGKFLYMFGKHGNVSGYFARPKGIATDSFGHIYVADALFHVVQVFDHEGCYLYAFGSQGTGEGQFWMPSGICTDQDNHIFVSDTYNKRIQVFKLVED